MFLIDQAVGVRNGLAEMSYKYLLKPILFARDPEDVHDFMTGIGVRMGKTSIGRALTHVGTYYGNSMLHQTVCGIKFKNPIGLSAGFDKNAQLLDIMPHVGFGFEELGSVTGLPCKGNDRPRLWRLPAEKSIIIYYGLKNDGCEAIAKRLAGRKFAFPFGVSVAKTNCKETANLEVGIKDYCKAYKTFVEAKVGDYYTLNLSCPNAFGGQPFQDRRSLDMLLTSIDKSAPRTRPIFLKLSPDLSEKEYDDIVDVSISHGVQGLIATNLTKKLDLVKIVEKNVPDYGGRSGKIVEPLADKVIRQLYRKSKGKLIIIGVGGVFNACDAYRKIRLGSTLLQMITGMLYQGPHAISSINLGLVKLLKKDGFKNISEAIGIDNRY